MKANVLVIDNKMELQKTIKNYMKEIICNVYSKGDKINGLKLFHEKNYNLVICNLSNSLSEGIDVIRQIKKRRPETSIVAISDGAKAEDFSIAKESGADRFLYEPFSKNELIDTFNSIGYFISS